MILDFLTLAAGFVLLGIGGNGVVQGASSLALRFGIPPFVVGLTVVGFGTSAPELAVNLQAALGGSTKLSFGNVVGSNISNIGLILGICALVKPPLNFHGMIIRREVPMGILASVAALVMASDLILTGAENTWNRGDGLLLLLFFCVFIYYTTAEVIDRRRAGNLQDAETPTAPSSTIVAALYLFFGIGALVAGGNLTVAAAKSMATDFGIDEAVIGLTVVAIGTSLPELVTSLVATMKGHRDIAVGNVLGSNLFNLLLIGGITSTVRDIEVPAFGHTDLIVQLSMAAALLPFPLIRGKQLVRWHGAALVIVYVVYLSVRVASRT